MACTVTCFKIELRMSEARLSVENVVGTVDDNAVTPELPPLLSTESHGCSTTGPSETSAPSVHQHCAPLGQLFSDRAVGSKR